MVNKNFRLISCGDLAQFAARVASPSSLRRRDGEVYGLFPANAQGSDPHLNPLPFGKGRGGIRTHMCKLTNEHCWEPVGTHEAAWANSRLAPRGRLSLRKEEEGR